MSTTISPAAKPRRALPPLMTLTNAAAERLRRLYATGQQGKLLRISVNTKGCSGLAYDMSWADAAARDQMLLASDVAEAVRFVLRTSPRCFVPEIMLTSSGPGLHALIDWDALG